MPGTHLFTYGTFRKIWPGAIPGFGIVVLFSGNLTLGAASFRGAVALVVQAAVYALGATHSKKYKVNISPLQVVTVQLLAAAVELTLLGLIFERHRPITVSALGIISLIYLAVFGASLAFLRHYRGNHRSLPDICDI